MDELPQRAFDQLKALKHDLQSMRGNPWEVIEPWINRANPIIQKWLPDSLALFNDVSIRPRARLTIQQLSACSGNPELKRQFVNELNHKTDIQACERILGFLEGILIAHAPDSSAGSKSISDKSDRPSVDTSGIDKRKVFVVYGRNSAAREAMFQFLQSINLHPLEWPEIVRLTGKAAPYIGEVLEKGFSTVQAVVVMLTPDDEARLLPPFHAAAEKPFETNLTPQPRPNVIFEAGMSLGLFPTRTVIVELGELRPMSDILGRHVIRMSNSLESRQDLADRLKTAGCDVQTIGMRWHQTGDFESCVRDLQVLQQTTTEQKFMAYLGGLSGDELYRLAIPVIERTQSILTGTNEPTIDILVAKGFIERVLFEVKHVSDSVPYLIPPTVWEYLNTNREWLLKMARERNEFRFDRLKELE